MSGTNRQYIYDAKKIKNSAPDLLKEVKDGNLTIPEAKKVAELPLEERTKAVTSIRAAPTSETKKQAARDEKAIHHEEGRRRERQRIEATYRSAP